MAQTDIGICNAAFVMVGSDGTLNSFSDNTVEANLASNVYQDTRDMLLQYHPWRFSLKQADLGGKLTAEPLFKWRNQFQLPADLLRVISLKDNVDYEIIGNKLYTDVEQCQILYQYKVPEQAMPSYFVRALHFHLARLFSISLQEDVAKMTLFDQAADKETARARSIDTQQQPNDSIVSRNYTLISVRG
jgi:hypothetical protein